jgi:hypothetical protein
MRTLVSTGTLVALLACNVAIARGPDFGTVIDNLDRRKVTKLHAQEYCKNIRGENVSWSGTVHDVKGGRRGAKVFVAEGSRPTYRGYNVVLKTDDMDRAAAVKKGQHIKFKGQIHGCTMKDNGAIIELEGAALQ